MCRRGSNVVGNVSQFLLAVWRQAPIDVTMHIGGFVLTTAFTGPLSASAAHAAGLSHGKQPAVRMPGARPIRAIVGPYGPCLVLLSAALFLTALFYRGVWGEPLRVENVII